ncbi:acyl-CoA dehydrogenase [Pseudonocardia sulfidoxydans NBRC 16205]|uniref:Acyl-CoA dehydrogenase n=2 Tax=Pseudonocardia sulfidoxydans TaxID=54011 RepID=A0A511DF22_9PSEU|nr:acyl-CoA dehydrogenase family protein [Pseudonocardia sulfidoxydans]GEL23137.1 acyl-CoA dehydrogenase [Pseudonocardia sulfidoxydans NBRC 16205]
MDFGLSTDRADLVDWARGLAARAGGLDHVRGLRTDPAPAATSYRALGAAGLLGLGLGSGDQLDRALACEQLGAELLWTPQFDSAICTGELLAATEGGDVPAGLPDGSWIVAAPLHALAHPVELPPADTAGPDVVVRSPWLPIATHVAVAVWLPPDRHEGDLAVVLVPRAEWTARPAGSYVDHLPVHETRLPAATLLDRGRVIDHGDVAAALDVATSRTLTAVAAFAVGAARRALETAARYATDRVQFGRPIGSFQAQQHKLADALLHVRQAEQLVRAAAVRTDPAAHRLASAAAARLALKALRQAAYTASIVHGGYGLTLEFDVHLYFVYAQILDGCYGRLASQRLAEESRREAS